MDVDVVAKSLKQHGFNAAPIHGDLDQSVRTKTLDGFRDGIGAPAGRLGRGGARAGHSGGQPRVQLRRAVPPRGLRPPHRPHGPRGTAGQGLHHRGAVGRQVSCGHREPGEDADPAWRGPGDRNLGRARCATSAALVEPRAGRREARRPQPPDPRPRPRKPRASRFASVPKPVEVAAETAPTAPRPAREPRAAERGPRRTGRTARRAAERRRDGRRERRAGRPRAASAWATTCRTSCCAGSSADGRSHARFR